MEAHSGQESFDGYIQRNRQILLEGLKKAGNWQEAHKALAVYGIGVKSGNNGLVLYDVHGKHHAKASSLSRDTSRAALEKRFGEFEPAKHMQVKEIERYGRAPLQHDPNRDNLYQKYLADLAQKKEEQKNLDILKVEEQSRKETGKQKWIEYRQHLRNNNRLTAKDRWNLAQQTYIKQKEEMDLLAKPRQEKQAEIREKFPFSSWTDYLKTQALAGNETALDILRSKKEKFQSPEQKQTTARAIPYQPVDYAKQKMDILNNSKMTTKDKKKLLAIVKLQEKTKQETKVSISPCGVLILALPSGGTIRDTGKQIHYSVFDPAAQTAAVEYSKIKWGSMSQAKGNEIVFSPKKKELGLGR
jgi:hypothetical protein